jgi:hypothetical protein
MKSDKRSTRRKERNGAAEAAPGAHERTLIADEYSGASLSAVRYTTASRQVRYPSGSMC